MSFLVSTTTIRKSLQQLRLLQYAGATRAFVVLAEGSRNNVFKLMKVSEMSLSEGKCEGKIVMSKLCRYNSSEPSQEIWKRSIEENIAKSSSGTITAPIL
jgi:hypothetical protein